MAKSKIIFSEEVEFDSTFPGLVFANDSPAKLKEVQVWQSTPTADEVIQLFSNDIPSIENPNEIDPNAIRVPFNKATLIEALKDVNKDGTIIIEEVGPFELNEGITKKANIISSVGSTIITNDTAGYGFAVRVGASGSIYDGLVIDGGKNARVTLYSKASATFNNVEVKPDTTTNSAQYGYLVQKDSVANVLGGKINTRSYAVRVMGGGHGIFTNVLIDTINAGSVTRHLWLDLTEDGGQMEVINCTIDSKNSIASVEQITIRPVGPGTIKVHGNTIKHAKSAGHTIGVGSENSVEGGDEKVTYSIKNNIVEGFRGRDKDESGIIHTIFVGFNANGEIDSNTVIGGGHAFVWKGTGTLNTTGYLSRNIALNCHTGIRLKGIDGAKITNNTMIVKGTNSHSAVYFTDNDGEGSANNLIHLNNIYVNLDTDTVAAISGKVSFSQNKNNAYICKNDTAFLIRGVKSTFKQWVAETGEENSWCLIKTDTGYNVYKSSDPDKKSHSITEHPLIYSTGKLKANVVGNPLIKSAAQLPGLTDPHQLDLFGNPFNTAPNIGADQTNIIYISPVEEEEEEEEPITKRNLALGIVPTIKPKPTYPLVMTDNDAAKLTDGKTTTEHFWTTKSKKFTVGWVDKFPAIVEIDLGDVRSITDVTIRTARNISAGVKFPGRMDVYLSKDDINYYHLGNVLHYCDTSDGDYRVETFARTFEPSNGRFVKIYLTPGKGAHSIFTDEIEIIGFDTPNELNNLKYSISKSEIDNHYKDIIVKYRQVLVNDYLEDILNKNDVIENDRMSEEVTKRLRDIIYAKNAAKLRSIYDKTIIAWTTPMDEEFSPTSSPNLSDKNLPPIVGITFDQIFESLTKYTKKLNIEENESLPPTDITDSSIYDKPVTVDVLRSVMPILDFDIMGGSNQFQALNILSTLDSDEEIEFEINANDSIRDYITLKECVPVYTFNYKYNTDPIMDLPESFILSPGQSRQLILEIKKPPVGNYTGTVKIMSKSNIVLYIPFVINVYPTVIPEDRLPDVDSWAYTSWRIIQDRLPEAIADLKEHHNNVGIINQYHLPMLNNAGMMMEDRIPLYKADLQTFSTMKYIQIYFNLKEDKIMNRFGNYKSDRDGWKTKFKEWANKLIEIAEELYIPRSKLMFYPIDEPETDELVERITVCLESIKEIDPVIKTYTTADLPTSGSITSEVFGRMVDVCDVIQMLNLRLETRKELVEIIKAKNKELWVYVTTGGKDGPINLHYRNVCWKSFKYGATGVGFWCYANESYKSESVWDDFDGVNKYWSVIYDDPKTGKILSSKRWESFREGVEDMAILSMARERLTKASDIKNFETKLNYILDNPHDIHYLERFRRELIYIINK